MKYFCIKNISPKISYHSTHEPIIVPNLPKIDVRTRGVCSERDYVKNPRSVTFGVPFVFF